MTTPHHPITPPPKLVQEWMAYAHDQPPGADARVIANLAAQWGADQELEACCEWLVKQGWFSSDEHEAIEELRAARRPKPPSLAEEALALIHHDPANQPFLSEKGIDTLMRALERLRQLERLQQLEEQQ